MEAAESGLELLWQELEAVGVKTMESELDPEWFSVKLELLSGMKFLWVINMTPPPDIRKYFMFIIFIRIQNKINKRIDDVNVT